MKKLFLFVCATAMAVSCVKSSDDCAPAGVDTNEIGISADITQATVTPAQAMNNARAAYAGSTASWKDNDSIGIFSAQAKNGINAKYTVTGVASTPSWTATAPMYWADGATSHTFTAYAPYAAGNTSASAVKIPKLSVQTGVMDATMDFLYSKNLATAGVLKAAGNVGLIFTHAFTLIEFKVKINTSVASGTTLTSFTLAAGASDKVFTTDAASTIALTDGTVTAGATTNTATLTLAPAKGLSETAVSVYVIILPGTFTAPTLTMTLSESGSPVSVPAATVNTTVFAPGSKYSYNVNVSRTAISISNPTITDWTTVNGSDINAGI